MSYFSQMVLRNTTFSNRLIRWYLDSKRDLPWRHTIRPYFIWLSEIIMQQTRVAQGLPYYMEFISKYPDVHQLAQASEEEILKTWQGLGYYSRARNLHATAIYISEKRNGEFPQTYQELLQLKGVGDYTASAIASICYDLPEAVVDGNVFRVLSRVFGISTPINSGEGKKKFKKLAQELIDPAHPGDFNQAIMEFGATQCVPRNPDCASCIFQKECFAFQNGRIYEFPVKLKSKPVKKRYFNYIIPISPINATVLNQRTEKDIWKKLYEFPLIETQKKIGVKELKAHAEFKKFEVWNIQSLHAHNEKLIVHKLSHQHIYTRFWILKTSSSPDEFISLDKLTSFPVPVLIEDFINEVFQESQMEN